MELVMVNGKGEEERILEVEAQRIKGKAVVQILASEDRDVSLYRGR